VEPEIGRVMVEQSGVIVKRLTSHNVVVTNVHVNIMGNLHNLVGQKRIIFTHEMRPIAQFSNALTPELWDSLHPLTSWAVLLPPIRLLFGLATQISRLVKRDTDQQLQSGRVVNYVQIIFLSQDVRLYLESMSRGRTSAQQFSGQLLSGIV
jgi:hypothetical protein